MATINQLNATDSLNAGDLIPVYVSNNGDARKASVKVLQDYMQDNLTFADTSVDAYTRQSASPSATGFSVAITPSIGSVFLILTPVAGYATGTIVLPDVSLCSDKQMVMVHCTQVVTALTINGSGATLVSGAPSALTAASFFTLRYDLTTTSWYRVG